MMTALMSNVETGNNYKTTCVIAAIETSDELFKLLDFAGYLSGGFNLGTFMQSINVMLIKLMAQQERCGVNELYIMWDTIMSSVAAVSGAAVNLIIMVGVGYANSDTAPYKAYGMWTTAYDSFDWLLFGRGFQLLMSQIVKYDAPDIDTDLVGTYQHF